MTRGKVFFPFMFGWSVIYPNPKEGEKSVITPKTKYGWVSNYKKAGSTEKISLQRRVRQPKKVIKVAHPTNEIFRAAPKTDASDRYMIFHTDAHNNCVFSK